MPVEAVLGGGLATLPLAPLADVPVAGLPAVIRRMGERLGRGVGPAEAGVLWTATYWLLGLRLPAGRAGRLSQGVRAMLESSTYRATLAEGEARGRAEGRAEEAGRILLRLGSRRFGPPGEGTAAALEGLGDVERIEQLAERVLEAASWEKLLAAD